MRFTPRALGDDPFVALEARLGPYLERCGPQLRSLLRQLRATPDALAELAQAVLAGRPHWAELVLFIDQFEEIFSLPTPSDRGTPSNRDLFIKLLAHAAQAVQRVRIVMTLRVDLYARCAESPQLAELLRGGSYPLAAPGVGTLREMITRPAALAGLVFDDGLVDQMLNDAGTEPGALTLLAFTLAELYKERTPKGRITYTVYEKIGGVKGAVGKHAQETFRTLKPDVQAALGSVFQELVDIDEWGVTIRKRAPVHRMSGAAREALVDTLTNAGLLVKNGGAGMGPVVEVAHEALFEHWDALRQWLDDNRRILRFRRRFVEAVRYWEEQKRPDGLLWRPPDLDLVRDFYAGTDRYSMTTSQRAFFQASLALQKREQRRQKRQRLRRLIGLVGGAFLTNFSLGKYPL